MQLLCGQTKGYRTLLSLIAIVTLLWAGGSCAYHASRDEAALDLPQSAVDPITGEASYDRARSLLAHGRPVQAAEVLESEPTRSSISILQSDRGQFLLGVLALRNNRLDDAFAHFEQISGDYNRIADYKLWYEAEVLQSMGKPDEARDRLISLVNDYPDSIWRDRALWNVFEIQQENFDQETQAAFSIDLLLSNWLSSQVFEENAGRSGWLLSQNLLASGRKREALDLLELLARKYPAEPEAAEAAKLIPSLRRELGLPAFELSNSDYLFRIKRFYQSGMIKETWSDLGELLTRIRPERDKSSRDDYITALRWKGTLYQADNDVQRAIRLYSSAIEHGFDPDGTFRFRLAKLHARTSNARAIKDYLLLVKHHPQADLAPEALYTAARLAQFAKNDRLANSLFGRLFDEYPDSQWVPMALFNQGWIAFRQERYGMAADSFKEIIARFSDSDEYLRAIYWTGRAYELLGMQDEARSYYELLQAENAPSYYGAFAGIRLAGRDPADVVLAAADPDKAADLLKLPEARTRPESWMWKAIDAFRGKDKKFLERAGELIALGLLPEAEAELERTAKTNADDQAAIVSLIPLLEQAKAWRASQRWAYYLNNSTRPQAINDDTLGYWKVLYPLGYAPYVSEYAKRHELDPNLVLSIIREESHFDSRITSWADARGLMQIIPPTGEQIARATRMNDFDAERLYDPETNIRFGCYYLSQLLRRFNGNPIYAIASYNGGPHNVEKWHKENGQLRLDEFIEEIPFHETRNYVKKVYRSWALYNQLYSGESRGPKTAHANTKG